MRRVVTSSVASPGPADERRAEPVAPSTAEASRSSGEAAVASPGPGGPPQGRETVGEGLEAVAEVGLRGHGFC